jgi:hypothetical protein
LIPITTYLSHLLGDAERGEELAHETFLRTYRAMVKGVAVEHLKAWLYRIATTASSEEAVCEREGDHAGEKARGSPLVATRGQAVLVGNQR